MTVSLLPQEGQPRSLARARSSRKECGQPLVGDCRNVRHGAATGSHEVRDNRDLTAKDPAASPVVLRGREQEVDTIAISSDSRWLVTGTIDGLAYLWPLQVKDLVDLAHTTAGRNFTAEEWELYFPDERYRKTFADSPGP